MIIENLDLKNPQDLIKFIGIIEGFGFNVVHDPLHNEIKVKGTFIYSGLPSEVLILRNKSSEIIYYKNKGGGIPEFEIGLRNREIVYKIIVMNNIDVYYSCSSLLIIY
jgi:hypothetical protein